MAPALISDELAISLRPFAAYRALVLEAEAGRARGLGARLATFSVLLAGFISLTTSGRLLPIHFLASPIAWAFVPTIQLASVAIVWGVLARRRIPLVRALGLHLAGNGPWMLFMLGMTAAVLLSPDVGATFLFLLDTPALAIVLVVVIVHGMVTGLAFWREGVGLKGGMASVAVAVEYTSRIALFLLWFAQIDNLVPEFSGARGLSP